MSPEQRAKRARRICERAEIYLVPSVHGSYLKVCARWRKAGGKTKKVRPEGTFARVPLGTRLSRPEFQALVERSVIDGRVLDLGEAQAVIFAVALTP